ncbi:hypothetical protein GCM10009854_06190 [Saccharopolyspora halophila]|uniref:Uncharacterized protein n=1 Tax=Saccharopolyspora halophila TaxID=405551 RepID=A0ABN3FMD5_9PSEU
MGFPPSETGSEPATERTGQNCDCPTPTANPRGKTTQVEADKQDEHLSSGPQRRSRWPTSATRTAGGSDTSCGEDGRDAAWVERIPQPHGVSRSPPRTVTQNEPNT